jgi:Cu(I)/Ag(I) efflux system membrane fusion protein
MDLVPAKQISASQGRLKERAGIETEEVGYRPLIKEIRTLGKIDANERQVAFIASRISGRVDRVHADFTGVPVKKGDHLVDIYSPDLLVGQSELIRAVEAVEKEPPGGPSFAKVSLDAARTKLSLLGLLPEQLREIEKSRKVQTHLTIYAPIGGTVVEKSIRAGQYVKEGDALYRIVDLDPVWLFLDIYEYDLSWVRFGQKVNVSVEAFPGEAFPGVVTFLDPTLEDKTRTVKARVNLPNPERKLRPGMYASASLLVRLRSDGSPEPTGLEGKFVCPMHPEVVRDGPGKCPVCEMPLERVPDGWPALKNQAAGHGDHTSHGQVPKEPSKHVVSEAMVLAVRATAVLDTGKRKVAYRVTKDGAYELVELDVGVRAESKDKLGRSSSAAASCSTVSGKSRGCRACYSRRGRPASICTPVTEFHR